jgi:8-oxo-dGTP diphosphatase
MTPPSFNKNKSFQVTIKGLHFDKQGRVLMVQERDGIWDLPGGRLEHGESFAETLKRECREEMGIPCKVLDQEPRWSWSARGRDGLWKVVLCFRIHFPHLRFKRTEECVAVKAMDAQEFKRSWVTAQTRPLGKRLKT